MPENPPADVLDLDLPAAQERLEAIRGELETLGSNNKDLSDEDDARFADLVREHDRTDKHYRTLKREEDLRRIQKTFDRGAARVEYGSSPDAMDRDPVGDPRSIERNRFARGSGADPFDLTNVRTFDRTQEQVGAELRERALSAIERMYGMTAPVREAATKIVEQYDNHSATISRHALLTGSPEYLSAWVKMARYGPQAAQLEDGERTAVTRAMSLADAGGGYLVPFQMDPTVIITSSGSLNDIRQAARTVVATGDVWYGVSAGEVAWSYDAEAAAVSDDTPTFAQPAINIHMARGFVPISIQAMQDEANVTAEVGRLLAFGKDTLEATKFTLGSGTGEPQGLITAISATDGTGSDRTVDVATANTIAVGDIYALHDALPGRWRRAASFLANNVIYSRVRALDTAGGASLWTTLGNERPGQLIGRPALEAEAMDSTLTPLANDYVMLFGDMSAYVIADRIGMQVELIPHLFDPTGAGPGGGMPTGQRGWFAYVRNGAGVVNTNAFRLLNAPG